MVHFLNIGGQERPLCFDQSLAYEYERRLNRSYLRDLNELFQQIAQVGQSVGTNDIGKAAESLSVVSLVNFFFVSMCLGCRRESRKVDFDENDVADWILGSQDIVAQFTMWLVEANMDTKKEDNPSKKK